MSLAPSPEPSVNSPAPCPICIYSGLGTPHRGVSHYPEANASSWKQGVCVLGKGGQGGGGVEWGWERTPTGMESPKEEAPDMSAHWNLRRWLEVKNSKI